MWLWFSTKLSFARYAHPWRTLTVLSATCPTAQTLRVWLATNWVAHLCCIIKLHKYFHMCDDRSSSWLFFILYYTCTHIYTYIYAYATVVYQLHTVAESSKYKPSYKLKSIVLLHREKHNQPTSWTLSNLLRKTVPTALHVSLDRGNKRYELNKLQTFFSCQQTGK